jgi:DNA-binding MarR family transcriptional regulator
LTDNDLTIYYGNHNRLNYTIFLTEFYIKRMEETNLIEDFDNNQGILSQYINKTKNFPSIRLFFWLLRCADVLDKYAGIEAESKGISRTGLSIMQILLKYPDGIPQQIIAKRANRTKQAIAISIDNLVKKGFVKRFPDKKDRRINSIRITKEGLDFLRDVFPHTIKMCDEALSCLSSTEMEQLLLIIPTLTKSLWQKTEGRVIKRKSGL